jgi:alcohol dehydrogenase
MSPSEHNRLFIHPTKIHFGKYDSFIISEKIDSRSYAFVTSNSFKEKGNLKNIISSVGYEPSFVIDDVPSQPSIQYINNKNNLVKKFNTEVIVALGGGSSIDSAKAFARMAATSRYPDINSIIEAQKKEEIFSSLPVIAIPTTAGTGSEVTPFATIWNFENQKKLSVFGRDVFPEWALVFPELTSSAPKKVLVSAALDALSHSFESVWSKKATKTSEHHAFLALKELIPTLACLNFDNPSIDELTKLATGSLNAGLAISESQTAIAHSISYPITYKHNLSHGLACSFTLPSIIDYALELEFQPLLDILSALELNLKKDYYNFFCKLFVNSGARLTFHQKIPNGRDIEKLLPQMLQTGRAKNFILPISDETLKTVIKNSLKFIYE